MSYLSELLRADQILLELRGRDKNEVLHELVALVPELRNEAIQREAFFQSLLERERLHTTGIGDGIALPHCRNAMGGLLRRPLLIFGRHSRGVQYGSLDQKPVQLLFLLASPNLTDHLAMLARLSRILRDPKVRAGLLAATNSEEVPKLIEEAEKRMVK